MPETYRVGDENWQEHGRAKYPLPHPQISIELSDQPLKSPPDGELTDGENVWYFDLANFTFALFDRDGFISGTVAKAQAQSDIEVQRSIAFDVL